MPLEAAKLEPWMVLHQEEFDLLMVLVTGVQVAPLVRIDGTSGQEEKVQNCHAFVKAPVAEKTIGALHLMKQAVLLQVKQKLETQWVPSLLVENWALH